METTSTLELNLIIKKNYMECGIHHINSNQLFKVGKANKPQIYFYLSFHLFVGRICLFKLPFWILRAQKFWILHAEKVWNIRAQKFVPVRFKP